ncbi:MAG: IS66 family insertion sequence element accessory protein TnpB [Sandaracinaceae bacterium]|nr:IS66 family insertion sequence element accessory protein TnpB [Sandaracinaceae bacterium]
MLGLPLSVRIYFATEPVDMRNGIDGLCALVKGTIEKDVYEGHLFVFVGKSKNRVKVLFWDHGGFVVYMKRLERGRFQMPKRDARRAHIVLEASELAMLLDGIDLSARRLSRWTPRGIDKRSEI